MSAEIEIAPNARRAAHGLPVEQVPMVELDATAQMWRKGYDAAVELVRLASLLVDPTSRVCLQRMATALDRSRDEAEELRR